MNKPILLIMAAGMGSRYGGLKQVDPVDDEGNAILDYSIYDAIRAGIEDIVFIIKKEHKELFEELYAHKLNGKAKIHFAYQTMELPNGFSIPEGRVKPWGTAHAVMSAREYVHGPFMVINADDFYGRQSFQKLYDFLLSSESSHAMIAFDLNKTITENGSVSRGIIGIDNGNMTDIVERTRIEHHNGKIAYTENGVDFVDLDPDTKVSMNIWGFRESMMSEFVNYFPIYLDENLNKNPLKCEYYITIVPSILVRENHATIKALHCDEKWYGITYKEDKPTVVQALKQMKANGIYPDRLWS